jgi:RNA polymerase sigma-70 factor (ECF subfamily)
VNPCHANMGNGLSSRPAASFRSARMRFSSSKKKRDAQFAQLVEPLQGRIYRLALRITRNTEDAEDAQQEAMLKAHHKLEQFEGKSRFSTWISRIAINEALMHLRKKRRAVLLPLEEAMPLAEETLARDNFQSGFEGPEEAYFDKELTDLFTRAIAKLNPAYRMVFLLRAVEQLSTSETAKVLQISVSAAKGRMRLARSQLQDYLRNARTATTHKNSKGSLNCS